METASAKAIYKQRAPVAEFPNAWLKDKLRWVRLRCRGIVKAQTEALWTCLTYNLQRYFKLSAQPACERKNHWRLGANGSLLPAERSPTSHPLSFLLTDSVRSRPAFVCRKAIVSRLPGYETPK